MVYGHPWLDVESAWFYQHGKADSETGIPHGYQVRNECGKRLFLYAGFHNVRYGSDLGSSQGCKRMSLLPKSLSVQTLNSLRGNVDVYETHRSSIAKTNEIITALGPGSQLPASLISISSGMGTAAQVTSFNGTAKRGTITIQTGTAGLGANPTITLSFPSGTYDVAPFAQVTRNGGNGTLGYTYTESKNQLVIALVGTPTAGTTYTFRYAVQE